MEPKMKTTRFWAFFRAALRIHSSIPCKPDVTSLVMKGLVLKALKMLVSRLGFNYSEVWDVTSPRPGDPYSKS